MKDPRLPFEPAGLRERLLLTAAQRLMRHNALWRANFTVDGRLAGRRLRVPFVFGAGWEHLRMRELWMFHLLEWALARRPGAALDVGVNVGHTLIKIKAADPDREYIGFEPNPHCLHYAGRLVAANAFSRCRIVPVALSNRTGMVTMFLNPDVDPSATIVEGFRDPTRYARTMVVPVCVGDEVMGALDSPAVAVVKIDVEGGELDVMQGLSRTLERQRPFIVCEVLPVFDERSDVGRFRLRRQTVLCELLMDLGYEIFRMHLDETVEELTDFGTHADLSLVNYVFVPHEESAAFRARFRERTPTTISRRSA